jgi:hypothetical protein
MVVDTSLQLVVKFPRKNSLGHIANIIHFLNFRIKNLTNSLIYFTFVTRYFFTV